MVIIIRKILCLALIFILLFTYALPLGAQEHSPALITEVKTILSKHYIDPVSIDVLLKDTIPEILRALGDPYTQYYTDQEFLDFWNSLSGKFGGVGLVIDILNNQVEVMDVLPNTPAAKANIQKRDIITHINNRPLEGMAIEEVTQLFRGNPGTSIRLRIYRPRSNLNMTYLLTREFITVQSIESHILARNVGYIKISEFNQEAGKEFPKHLNHLKGLGIKGLILDLRDNPGGLIGVALDMSKELIPPGPFVQLSYRGQKPDIISTLGTTSPLPLIVLVNNNSASASEILAGAIQDRQSGIIIGTNTYGKASVQSLLPLVNGGALKFTSGNYLTPKGRQIRDTGIAPDFLIQDPQDQLMQAIWVLEKQGSTSLLFQVDNKNYLVNGRLKELPIEVYVSGGHIMVPLRQTIESLGGRVSYRSPDRVQIALGPHNIVMGINQSGFQYNGRNMFFPVRPELRNGLTTVPIRYLAELLNAHVEWQNKSGQVIISR